MKSGKAENAEENLFTSSAREFGFPLRIGALLFSALQGLLISAGGK
ncbi:MAG: hypothetical protein ACRD82_02440 [Blastocatellia bacterium]